MISFAGKIWRNNRRRSFYRSFFPEKNLLVFDIGAHTGNKSRLFLELGCKVVAIEPQKNCMAELKKLKEKYPFLIIENCAVGKQEEQADFFTGVNSETSTLSNDFKTHYEKLGTAKYISSEKVPVTTLKKLFQKHGVPYYLKIDAEGFDEQIISTLDVPVEALEFEYLQPFKANCLNCVDKILSLDHYEFNFCRNEHPSFYFSRWQGGDEFKNALQALPNSVLHGNIFARQLRKTWQ